MVPMSILMAAASQNDKRTPLDPIPQRPDIPSNLDRVKVLVDNVSVLRTQIAPDLALLGDGFKQFGIPVYNRVVVDQSLYLPQPVLGKQLFLEDDVGPRDQRLVVAGLVVRAVGPVDLVSDLFRFGRHGFLSFPVAELGVLVVFCVGSWTE